MFLIYKNSTKEIYTVSDRNDTVIPEGYSIIQLEGRLKEVKFPAHPSLCNFIDNTIVLDEGKYKQKIKELKETEKEDVLIRKKIKEIAVRELKAEGKIK